MKKLLFTIIVCSFSLSLLSQSCLPEGITFTTQEQIDNFQTENPGCTEIEGDVTISGDNITNLIGLNVITSFHGDLLIKYNELVTSLTGLDNVTYIGGDLLFKRMYALTNLLGLENLTTIEGSLIIGLPYSGGQYGNGTSLVDLCGLDNLISIGGDFEVIDNYALTSFTGCDNLVYIGGDVNINENIVLSSLTGLENLNSIEGGLNIGDFWPQSGNPSLTSLTGLDNLSSIGWFYLANNDALTSLMGLNNLNSIAGPLSIAYNDALSSLTGLDNLISIGGDLYISSNDALSSLTGLINLVSIVGGHLSVRNNYVLTSLTGLDNIEAGGMSGITITSNYSLATCEVQSICDYIATPGGRKEIHDNAPGCNSPEEVEEACETVSIDEVSILGNITSSPNPFSTSTTLSYELRQPEKVILSIYSHLGQLIYQTQENQPQGNQQLIWNAEGFSDGIYYYRLEVGDAVANGKMVKVR